MAVICQVAEKALKNPEPCCFSVREIGLFAFFSIFYFLCHHKKTNNNNIPEHITWQNILNKQTKKFFVLRNFIDLVETMFIAIGVSIKIMMFKIITDGYSYFVSHHL